MTDTADLDYIVVGTWRDPVWTELARTTRLLSREELSTLTAGSRRHPFGDDAYQMIVDGEIWIFRNKAAADLVREVAGE